LILSCIFKSNNDKKFISVLENIEKNYWKSIYSIGIE